MHRSRIFTVSRYVLDRISPQEIRRDYAIDILLIPNKDLRVAYFEKELDQRVKSERSRLQKDQWVVEKVLALHHFQYWMNYLGLKGEYQTVEVKNPRRDPHFRRNILETVNPVMWQNQQGATLTVDITTVEYDETHYSCAAALKKKSGETDWSVQYLNIRKFEPIPQEFEFEPGYRNFSISYEKDNSLVKLNGYRLNKPFPWKTESEEMLQFIEDLESISKDLPVRKRSFKLHKTLPTPKELL